MDWISRHDPGPQVELCMFFSCAGEVKSRSMTFDGAFPTDCRDWAYIKYAHFYGRSSAQNVGTYMTDELRRGEGIRA